MTKIIVGEASPLANREPPDLSRFRWIYLTETEESGDLGKDVIDGLTSSPKSLPCRYLYDDSPEERLRQRGSQLFERITELPEYYPTRTERALLERYASEIVRLTGHCDLIEFGSGSSSKTRILLDGFAGLVRADTLPTPMFER